MRIDDGIITHLPSKQESEQAVQLAVECIPVLYFIPGPSGPQVLGSGGGSFIHVCVCIVTRSQTNTSDKLTHKHKHGSTFIIKAFFLATNALSVPVFAFFKLLVLPGLPTYVHCRDIHNEHTSNYSKAKDN